MKYFKFVLLTFITVSAFAQNITQKKIIIITNEDTTILETDEKNLDSLVEWKMKSIFRIGNEIDQFPQDIDVEVYIDSIFGDINQTKKKIKIDNEERTETNEDKRVIIIEKDFNNDADRKKSIIEEKIMEEDDRDFSFNRKNKHFEIPDRDDFLGEEFAHWAGLSIGINGFLNDEGHIASDQDASFLALDYAKSFNFQFNVLEKRFPILKEYIGITTGIGLNWNRFGLQNNVDLLSNADSIYAIVNSVNNYRTNVLNATFLQFPLLLEFNTNSNPDKNWHLSVGMVGGIRIGANWKTKWETDGKPQKSKTNDDYHLNALSANAYAQFGYGNVGLFIQYGLTNVFSQNKGPNLSPFSAGLKIGF